MDRIVIGRYAGIEHGNIGRVAPTRFARGLCVREDGRVRAGGVENLFKSLLAESFEA
jgi:hypothetical protein